MSGDDADDVRSAGHLHDDLMTEYYVLVDAVAGFDQRLLTIKSWGVTFSLATLGLGFQQDHYGLFLVAAAAALAFWLIEVSTKRHQMRYYPRMGDIEVFAYELYGKDVSQSRVSSPLIDWSWHTASRRVWGERRHGLGRSRSRVGGTDAWSDGSVPTAHEPQQWPELNSHPGVNNRILLWPAVALPHAIAAALGLVLFGLGLAGRLGPI